MSTERIIISEIDQTQTRAVLSDVFNILVIDNVSGFKSVTSLQENGAKFIKEFEDYANRGAIANLINSGYGVYTCKPDDLSKYTDKYMYDVFFIMDMRREISDTDISNIDSFIKDRGDVLYLVPDYETAANSSAKLANDHGDSNPILSSYKTQYSPSVYLTDDSEVPASYCFLMNFAQSLSRGNPAWYAIAGVNRGLVNYIKNPTRPITETEYNSCQNKDSAENSNYNPIMYINSTYGNIIYGQRTLQKDNTALKSVNVRILSNMIKKRIFNISLGLLFEANDLALWNEFRGQLEPYLANMRYNRGLANYEIIMDQSIQNSNDPMTVKGKVRIQPIRSAEYFEIDIILTQVETKEEPEE